MLVIEVFFVVSTVSPAVVVAMCLNSLVPVEAAKSFAGKAFYFFSTHDVRAVPFPGG